MIDKLVSVKEFKEQILEDVNTLMIDRGHSFRYLCNYIDILEQPLKLEMFVPCFDGVPINRNVTFAYTEEGSLDGAEFYENLQQAEKKVLFEGFEIEKKRKNYIVRKLEDDFYKGEDNFYICIVNNRPVKSLLNFNIDIKLTDNFKQLITK